MLDFIGTIAITTVMVVAINAVISSLAVSRMQRIGVAVAVGLWIGLAAASANSGLFAGPNPAPIGLFLAVPLLVPAALAYVSPAWRAALLNLPTPLLVGLNLARPIGALFLLLAAEGRLSGPFPVSAGWGDILVGVLAIPALLIALRPQEGGRSFLPAWNLLGALDLVAAVTLGVTSAEGSPLQVFHVGAGSAAIQMLPWAFIPTVLVPFFLILHAILFAQLKGSAEAARSRSLLSRAA